MKKIILAFVLSVVLVVPSITLAATQEELQTQYHSALIQLIDLLMGKVKALKAELASIQANPAEMIISTTPVVQTPPTPVFGAVEAPTDIRKPRFAHFKLQGSALVIGSDELLDTSKMILPSGVTVKKVVYDATNGPVQEGKEVSSKLIGYQRGETVAIHTYLFELEGAGNTIPVTVQDLAGNTVTMTATQE